MLSLGLTLKVISITKNEQRTEQTATTTTIEPGEQPAENCRTEFRKMGSTLRVYVKCQQLGCVGKVMRWMRIAISPIITFNQCQDNQT